MSPRSKCMFCNEPEKAVLHVMEDDILVAVADAALDLMKVRGMTRESTKEKWDALEEALVAFQHLGSSSAAASAAVKGLKRIEDSLS